MSFPNERFPRVAASKEWQLNEKRYTLDGGDALKALSACYDGFDFEKFFAMTEWLYVVCHEDVNTRKARDCAMNILSTRLFFTELFALLDSDGMAHVLQLINDVYLGARMYHDEIRAAEPNGVNDNPFFDYTQPVMQGLYTPFFNKAHLQHMVDAMRPFDWRMDLHMSASVVYDTLEFAVADVLSGFSTIDLMFQCQQQIDGFGENELSVASLALALYAIRRGLERAEEAIWEQRASRGLAVMQAGHPRLGAEKKCFLHGLPGDVLKEIAVRSVS